MTGIDHERLRRLLGRPDLARVIAAIRERIERGGGESVSVADPTRQERRAVEELLGRRPGSAQRLRVPLAQIERILRDARIAPDLGSAIAALGGPLRDRPEERETERRAWDGLWGRHRPRAEAQGLGRWLDSIASDGLLKRLSGAAPDSADGLLCAAMAVLQRLPARGIALSSLAADAVGDAHGLDPGRPVAALVRRELMLRARDGAGGMGPVEDSADDALWASAGVLVGGGITSTVLALNLVARGDGPLATMLDAASRGGEPIYLTLRQILRDSPSWQIDDCPISVCENPAVVAEAASRLGPHCRPLICTRGQPSTATTTVLGLLAQAGATICYHGDFDWAGMRIANGVIARHGALPWRMSAVDYLAAPDSAKPLSGDPVDATWDARLAPAMVRRGQAIEEERVLDALLADLALDRE